MSNGPTQRGWWLEDAVVGSTIAHGGGRTIGAAEHVQLAWLTHNLSDVHGDAHAAAQSEWGEPLVLGALTAAIVTGLAAPATGPPRTAAAVVRQGWHSIRLEAIVMAGDTIRAESRIEAVNGADDDGARVRRTLTGRNQRGESVVVIRDEPFVPRRSGPGPSNV